MWRAQGKESCISKFGGFSGKACQSSLSFLRRELYFVSNFIQFLIAFPVLSLREEILPPFLCQPFSPCQIQYFLDWLMGKLEQQETVNRVPYNRIMFTGKLIKSHVSASRPILSKHWSFKRKWSRILFITIITIIRILMSKSRETGKWYCRM